jgi:hypothetical protein
MCLLDMRGQIKGDFYRLPLSQRGLYWAVRVRAARDNQGRRGNETA